MRKLKGQRVDILITEMLMPGSDGIELIRFARANGLPGLRILAMSGGGASLSGRYALDMARAFGADCVLGKPFGVKEMRDAVRTLAETGYAADQAT